MQQLKKSLALMIFFASMNSMSFAQNQDVFNLDAMLKFNGILELHARQAIEQKRTRAVEVMQDNQYTTCNEAGIFLSNQLMLDGKPLDFGEFNLFSKGELTVLKSEIPFYVYLKRNGNKVLIPGNEIAEPNQNKVDIAEILNHAQPGDYLVIEAVNKEDGDIKNILKVLGLGC